MKKHIIFKLLGIILLACTLPGNKAAAQISQTNATAAFSATNNSALYPGQSEFYDPGGALSSCSLVTGDIRVGRAGTNNYVDPLAAWSSRTTGYLGNTLGGAITVSFSCKHSGNAAILDFSYGPTVNGPWTVIPNLLADSPLCVSVTVPSFTFSEPGPVYVRFRYRPTYTNVLSNSFSELGNIAATEAPLPACSGLPTAGTTMSFLPTGCGNAAIPLRVSPSPNLSGVSYQWQSSSNGSTWVDITGATTKYTSVTQTSATYYRRKITCANGGQIAYSSSLLLTQANQALPCYCASGSTTQIGTEIYNLTLGNVNNTSAFGPGTGTDSVVLSGTHGIATGSRSQYINWISSTVPVPNLPRGLPQAFSVGLGATNPTIAHLKIYIDYNQDGDLLDANELIYSGNPDLNPTGTATGTITAPTAALLGNTLMRIVANDTATSLNNITPCGTFERGETHDYRVNILDGPACFGTPDVAVVAGPANACPNQAFALTASNLDPYGFPGLSYQWQSSAAGTNAWTDLPGDTVRTGVSFPTGKTVARDYRLRVTCVNSGLISYSNVFPVGIGIGTCFCTAAITTTAACQRWISGVTTTGAVTNMTNTSACTPAGFADYTAVTGPTQYRDYPLNLSLTSANGPVAWSIYVDYNNDGNFANNEQVYQNSNTAGGNTIAASFVVPLTAPLGVHRMRIRADSGATAATACTTVVSGETEDYILTVVEKPACTGTPASAFLSTTQPYIYCGAFPAKPLTLTGGTATGTGGVTGIGTTWERSNDSSFSSISINQFGATIGQNQSAFYRAKQTCATSGQFAYSNTILVADHEPRVNISPATAAFCAGSGGTLLTANVTVGVGGPALSYAWTAGGSPACNNCISCTTCNSITVNPAASAIFVLNVLGSSCPGSFFAIRNVTVNPKPTVTAAVAPASACSGGAITLTGVTDTPGIYSGFAGPFAPDKWDFSQTTSNGKIITSGAPSSVVFISSDSTALSPTGGSDDWAITIPYAGNITFDWTYSTNDSAGNDFVRYSLDGSTAFTNLPGFSNSGAKNQSGTAVIAVPAGAFFTLRGRSRTNTGGPSTTTISNFSAPGGTPGTVAWYSAPTGGNLVANPVTINTPGTYTYYAQAVSTAGCVSTSRLPSNPVTVHGAGRWTGAVDSSWNTAGNWCGGIPTVTSNLVIPGAITVPNLPVLSTTGSANNIELQTGSTLKVAGTGTLNVYGSFSGGGAFNAGAGTVSFAGSAPQTIPAGMTVGTLAVAGGSVKSLSGNARVNTALNFSGGLVDVGSHTLRLGAGAVVTGASASRYVRTSAAGGRLQQAVGTTPVVFPVGNAAYNPATLTNNGTADTFAVGVRDAVLLGGTTGSPVSPLNARVVNHTWDVEEGTPGGSDVTMKLQWNAGETNTSFFDYNHVQVAHYTGGSYALDPDYATPGAAPAAFGYPGGGPYTATRNDITSFSPFIVASSSVGSTPLPLTGLTLRAGNAGNRNRIDWEAAGGTDISTYTVERSADGALFSSMEETAAKGAAWRYTSYDDQPNPGFTYYRLKIKTPDGNFTYSQTVKAFMEKGGTVEMTVHPNPARDLLTVNLYGIHDGTIQVTDLSGRIVATAAVAGSLAKIDISNLASGTYFVRYVNGDLTRTITVTKQ